MKNIAYITLLSILTFSCALENENNELGGYIDDEEYQKEFIADNSETSQVEMEVDSIASDTAFIDFTNELIDLLDNNKLLSFASNFHTEKGCTFVPYTLIEGGEQNFTRPTFEEHLMVDDKLTWGFEDGSGDSINLGIKDYFKRYVYDADFKNKSAEVHINSDLTFSNTLDNINKTFPDAQFIEFYFDGTLEYYHMDWSSLIFYIEKLNDTYYLVAVVHNQWTI